MTSVACDVYWAHVHSLSERHTKLLASSEIARRRSYGQEADRDRFTLGAALLRLLVSRRSGLPAEAVPVDRTCPKCGQSHGRPRIQGCALEVSVTHSGDYVAVAVSTSPVGVDIEAIRPVDYLALVGEVCSPEERAMVATEVDFFHYWTRKESLLKAVGVGLGVPMCSVSVSPPREPPRVLSAPQDFPSARLAGLSPAWGYAGAVTVLTDGAVLWRAHDTSEFMRTA